MREMRIAECGLRNCQKSLNQAEHRRQWPRASCNSAIRIPHFFSPRARPGLKPFGNSAFRNPHSAFPLLPYDRNEANADCGMRIAKLPLACRHSYSAWSQAFWQFRISQSAFRISRRARSGLKPFGNSAFRNPHSAFPLLPYLPTGTSNREQ